MTMQHPPNVTEDRTCPECDGSGIAQSVPKNYVQNTRYGGFTEILGGKETEQQIENVEMNGFGGFEEGPCINCMGKGKI